MKIYNDIVSYDPSLIEHKDKIFSLIEQMVAAKPTFSFDSQRKEKLDAKIADHIAHAPVTVKPFSYGWMAKRGVSLASFWVIGVVAAASVFYVKIEHKQQQKIAQKKAIEMAQTNDTDMNIALTDTGMREDAEVTSTMTADSIVTTDLPVPQVTNNSNTTVKAVSPVLPPQAQWHGNGGVTMMADPEVAVKVAIVVLTSDALDVANNFSVPVVAVSDEMDLKSTLVFKTKVNVLRPADEKVRDGRKIATGLEKSLQEKNVIILHLNYPNSVNVAQQLIDELEAKGYMFVPLHELND